MPDETITCCPKCVLEKRPLSPLCYPSEDKPQVITCQNGCEMTQKEMFMFFDQLKHNHVV